MVLENLSRIRSAVASAARRSDRPEAGIELAAVVKKASLEDVRTLLASGQVLQFAENRIQDALRRRTALGPDAGKVRWRFIGHLQTNKVRQALEAFDAVDSLDSLRLAEALEHRLTPAGRTLDVLIQVKLTGREAQSGVPMEDVGTFLRGLARFPHLRPNGLMGIAPLEEEGDPRETFRSMRRLFEGLFPQPYVPGRGPYLSLGMSQDFETAVEEGANLLRIGTALFSR